jgi:hypothetical protein
MATPRADRCLTLRGLRLQHKENSGFTAVSAANHIRSKPSATGEMTRQRPITLLPIIDIH